MFLLKRFSVLAMALLVVVGAVATAGGETAWAPTKPLTGIDVGGTPGNAYDLILRQLASVMPDLAGVRMNVQNVPGAGGLTGMDMLVRSRPDGLTFGLCRVPTYIVLAIRKPLDVDVSSLKSPVAILVPPYVLQLSKKSRFKSFSDIMNSKEKVKISVTSSNMAMVALMAFFNEKGVDFVAARAKGTAEAEMPIRSGDADLYLAAGSKVGLRPVADGDATAILIFDDKRDPRFPETPCLKDVDMPGDFKFLRALRMFVFPPGVPEERLEVMGNVLTKAIEDQRTQEWSKKAGIPMELADRASLGKRMEWITKYLAQYPELLKMYFF